MLDVVARADTAAVRVVQKVGDAGVSGCHHRITDAG
jgi:hypothetical protein